MIRGQSNSSWSTVIQKWKSNFVFSSDLCSNNNLVNIIKFIPILVLVSHVSEQGLKLGKLKIKNQPLVHLKIKTKKLPGIAMFKALAV